MIDLSESTQNFLFILIHSASKYQNKILSRISYPEWLYFSNNAHFSDFLQFTFSDFETNKKTYLHIVLVSCI